MGDEVGKSYVLKIPAAKRITDAYVKSSYIPHLGQTCSVMVIDDDTFTAFCDNIHESIWGYRGVVEQAKAEGYYFI